MMAPGTTETEGPDRRARPRPRVVVFDVNETLSDLSPLEQRFADVGAPGHLAATWFAGVLRDGFALAAAGASAPFAEVGTSLLHGQLAGVALDRGVAAAVDHIMAGFSSLQVHEDVPAGIAELAGLGLRLVTLSNGSAEVAASLLGRAGLRHRFEQLLSVEDAGVWKPGQASYAYALGKCGVPASEVLLVAVHPWDIDGASRAGLSTAWINRTSSPYPSYFSRPDVEVQSLRQLAPLLE